MYGFVGGTKGKKTHLPVQKTQETESILRLGRSPRGGHGNPLQYSYLENHVDGGAWWAAVHRVAQLKTQLKRLSMHACIGEGNGNPL